MGVGAENEFPRLLVLWLPYLPNQMMLLSNDKDELCTFRNG